MLQNLIIVMIALSIIGLPATSFAETSSSSSSTKSSLKPFVDLTTSIKLRAEIAREKFKNERIEIRTDHKESLMEIKRDNSLSTSSKKEAFSGEQGSFLGKLDGLRSDRLEAYADRVDRRLSAAIERIENLIDRLEGRLGLLENKNKNFDGDEARDMLGKSKVSIGEAKVALADFQASMGELLATSTPKAAFSSVRGAAATVIEKIKNAHQNLVGAIKTIKIEANATATSTSSN